MNVLDRRRRHGGGSGVVWVSLALFLAGCPNMDDQSQLRPYEASPHFADGTSARPLPAHTVARSQPIDGSGRLTGRVHGALLTRFPLPVTTSLLERGRERYDIYCAVCHGEAGHGQGIVVRRGFPPPPSLHDERLRREPVGHFFEVITNGYGVMYPYADRVDPDDRWAIIAYIRALQRSQHATLADVPERDRAALATP